MNNELYHYNHNHDKLGRFTFTRGEYSSARSEAKARRRERDKKIADEYNRTTNDIGKSFKRSLRLNDEDTARWTAATDKVQKALADSKRQYKEDIAKAKAAAKEAKEHKKELKNFAEQLKSSPYATDMVTKGTMSQMENEGQVRAFRAYANAGMLYMKARFEANYKDDRVDMYLGDSKDPTMKAWIRNGEEFAYDFINDEDRKRYNRNIKYKY